MTEPHFSRRLSDIGNNLMDGNIFNSSGVHVGVIYGGNEVRNLKGELLYRVRRINIYRLTGDLVGHFANERSADKHLDKATDRLFA